MANWITKDRVITLLAGGLIFFAGSFIQDVRATMATVHQHDIRFGGVDGMIQQVIDIKTEMGTIKNQAFETNKKLDRIIQLHYEERKK